LHILLISDRNHKSLFVTSLLSGIELDFPIANGREVFWLDDRTVGYVATEEGTKTAGIYSVSVHLTNETLELNSDPPGVLLGKFPTASPSSFRYAAKAGVLVFSDNVYEDGDLTKVPKNDEKWQNRGHSALVYDDTFERHWDTWTVPKRPSLFTVKLYKDANERWHFGNQFYNVLNGTRHVGS
jgi:hypothetical protein